MTDRPQAKTTKYQEVPLEFLHMTMQADRSSEVDLGEYVKEDMNSLGQSQDIQSRNRWRWNIKGAIS